MKSSRAVISSNIAIDEFLGNTFGDCPKTLDLMLRQIIHYEFEAFRVLLSETKVRVQ